MTALLFGDPSPVLRWRAAVELNGVSVDDPEVVAWRAEAAASDRIRSLVAQLKAARADPYAAGYLLCQLAYMRYTGPEIADAAEAVFDAQQPDGSWQQPAGASRSSKPNRRRGSAPPDAFAAEPYSVLTMRTLLPLRGVAAAGFATDARTERAYEWLIDQRLDDGSWTGSHRSGYGFAFKSGKTGSGDPDYRKLTRGEGCRSATTGAVACFAEHPERRLSDAARIGVDHLLARETRDDANVGWEVSRLVGLERASGTFTFYVTHDPASMLDLASRCGVSINDRRVSELVAYLDGLRSPHGIWQHPAHPQLSRWLTFDIQRSLRQLPDGDWIGNEEPATFTPYKRGRRRY